MPDPAATATATLVASTVAVSSLEAFGVPLGLRVDLLVAGFSGSLAAIVLLNTVPSTGDTWQALVSTSGRRMAVAVASALTAGYLTPMFPSPWLLGTGFVIGAGAQIVLATAVTEFKDRKAKRGDAA
jgi:hypothetical protein